MHAVHVHAVRLVLGMLSPAFTLVTIFSSSQSHWKAVITRLIVEELGTEIPLAHLGSHSWKAAEQSPLISPSSKTLEGLTLMSVLFFLEFYFLCLVFWSELVPRLGGFLFASLWSWGTQ